jgi:hypothetical protein
VCEAITASRSRAVPSGTAGGSTASMKAPSLDRRVDDPLRALGVADHDRDDVALRARGVEALAREPSRSASALACSFSIRRGCSSSRSSAAIAAAIATGDGAVECSSVRALLTR